MGGKGERGERREGGKEEGEGGKEKERRRSHLRREQILNQETLK